MMYRGKNSIRKWPERQQVVTRIPIETRTNARTWGGTRAECRCQKRIPKSSSSIVIVIRSAQQPLQRLHFYHFSCYINNNKGNKKKKKKWLLRTTPLIIINCGLNTSRSIRERWLISLQSITFKLIRASHFARAVKVFKQREHKWSNKMAQFYGVSE